MALVRDGQRIRGVQWSVAQKVPVKLFQERVDLWCYAVQTYSHSMCPRAMAWRVGRILRRIGRLKLGAMVAKYYFDTKNQRVVKGGLLSWWNKLGPYDTAEEAARALDIARQKTAQWDEETRRLEEEDK